MIDVTINLRPTPSGLTRTHVSVMDGDIMRPVRTFSSLHATRGEALDEALLLVRAEVEEMAL